AGVVAAVAQRVLREHERLEDLVVHLDRPAVADESTVATPATNCPSASLNVVSRAVWTPITPYGWAAGPGMHTPRLAFTPSRSSSGLGSKRVSPASSSTRT